MPRLRVVALSRVFSPGLADAIASLAPDTQLRAIKQRIARLERIRVLAKARVAAHTAEDRDLEAAVVANARVVMCTLLESSSQTESRVWRGRAN